MATISGETCLKSIYMGERRKFYLATSFLGANSKMRSSHCCLTAHKSRRALNNSARRLIMIKTKAATYYMLAICKYCVGQYKHSVQPSQFSEVRLITLT